MQRGGGLGRGVQPRRERILTWSDDGTARLWDAATGQELVPAMKSGGAVWGATFDREERRILTGSVTARRGCGTRPPARSWSPP